MLGDSTRPIVGDAKWNLVHPRMFDGCSNLGRRQPPRHPLFHVSVDTNRATSHYGAAGSAPCTLSIADRSVSTNGISRVRSSRMGTMHLRWQYIAGSKQSLPGPLREATRPAPMVSIWTNRNVGLPNCDDLRPIDIVSQLARDTVFVRCHQELAR